MKYLSTEDFWSNVHERSDSEKLEQQWKHLSIISNGREQITSHVTISHVRIVIIFLRMETCLTALLMTARLS